MKNKNIENFWDWVIILSLILLFIFSFLLFVRQSSWKWKSDDYCKLRYGNEFEFYRDNGFGEFYGEDYIDFCVIKDYELLEIVERKEYNSENEMDEIRRICNMPNFWDLTIWRKNDCGF